MFPTTPKIITTDSTLNSLERYLSERLDKFDIPAEKKSTWKHHVMHEIQNFLTEQLGVGGGETEGTVILSVNNNNQLGPNSTMTVGDITLEVVNRQIQHTFTLPPLPSDLPQHTCQVLRHLKKKISE